MPERKLTSVGGGTSVINLPNVKGSYDWEVVDTVTDDKGETFEILMPVIPFNQLNPEMTKNVMMNYIFARNSMTGKMEQIDYATANTWGFDLPAVTAQMNYNAMKAELLKRNIDPTLLDSPVVDKWLEEQSALRQAGGTEEFLTGLTNLMGKVQLDPSKAEEILPSLTQKPQEPAWGDVGNAENWRQNLINALRTEGYTSEAEHVKSVIDKLSPTLQTPRPAGESGMIWQQTQDVVTEQQQRLQQLDAGAQQSFTPESIAARSVDEAEGEAAAEEDARQRNLLVQQREQSEREAPWRRLVDLSRRPSKLARL